MRALRRLVSSCCGRSRERSGALAIRAGASASERAPLPHPALLPFGLEDTAGPNFITWACPRDGTPPKPRKFRTIPGPAGEAAPSQSPANMRNSSDMTAWIAPRRSPVRVRLAPSELPATRLPARGRGGAEAGRVRLVNSRSTSCAEAPLAARVAIPGKEDCDGIERAPAAFGSSAASTASRTASTRYRVLDVGCGTGYFTRVMAEAVASDGTAHGVDPSAEAIAQAKGLTHLANSWL